MIQGAQGWYTGITQGIGWGGKWKGDSGWGTHVHPWWTCQCMAKPIQNCKVKNKLIN